VRRLGLWFQNLLQRVEQLKKWSTTLETPPVLWLSGLFNPMAFLTAVMQVTARQGGFPLDNVRPRILLPPPRLCCLARL
jgi:dynein heavy chain